MVGSRLYLALALVLVGARASAADPLVTGAAIYDLEMQGPTAGQTGSMTLSLQLECTAYRSDTTMTLELPEAAGGGKLALKGTQVEDGNILDFDLTGDLNGIVIERALGKATRTSDALAVEIREPAAKRHDFEGDILFPVALVNAVLDAAMAGKTIAEFRVFDGAGNGSQVWTVSVVITPVAPDDDLGEEALFASGLGFDKLKRWRMHFSYFPPGLKGDQTPAFSTEAVVYENGFTLAASYDLGFASMKLHLVEFRPIPPKPC